MILLRGFFTGNLTGIRTRQGVVDPIHAVALRTGEDRYT
jgi:hypothetical protein